MSVFHGVCRSSYSYREPKGLIVTRYEFEVVETLKGDDTARRICIQPGGIVGDVATVVPGLSPHAVGDEVILFLENVDPRQGYTLPVCLDRGVYRVTRDENGKKHVRGLTSEIHIARPVDSPGPTVEPSGFSDAGLAEFKEAIRLTLARSQGQEKR